MKISSDSLQVQSSHFYYQSGYSESRMMTAQAQSAKDFFERLKSTGEKVETDQEDPYLNYSSGGTLKDLQSRYQKVTKVTKTENKERSVSVHKLRQAAIMHMLEFLFGKRAAKLDEEDQVDALLEDGNAGWTTYQEEASYVEAEQTTFQMEGQITCEDGTQINLNLNLQMTRAFAQYYSANYAMPLSGVQKLLDPLVINLDVPAADLSDQTFTFDLDLDGKPENLHRLGSGSGFLALDQNEDGIINDGSELFGATSGDGFGDLAKYDEDHNGWIDENDAIFQKLRIWVKDANGQDALYGLAEKGVGAICLQSAATQMAINSLEDNKTQGIVRRTGMFLYENGRAGTIQHVDMAG